MRKGAQSLILLIALVTSQFAQPEPVRGGEQAPLLLSEFLTGGVSAADEYVRIEASGTLSIELRDIELIYVSASGLTTRRLVSLAAAGTLTPGGTLLIANALGQFGTTAQLTWSDGIASSGGVLQLRRVGTPIEVIDAVAWGSAALTAGGEGFPVPLQGTGVPYKRARSASGALIDTNMNSADFNVEAPVTSSPSASPTVTPLASSSASALPASPTASPSSPSASPTGTPVPLTLTVSESRAATVGSRIRVRGVLTAIPGELAEPLLAALSDPSDGAGLFVLLPAVAPTLTRGQLVELSGTLTLRRQTLTLVASGPPLLLGNSPSPLAQLVPRPAAGAWAWEAWEGRRIRVEGVFAGSPAALSDGAISLRLRLSSGEELLVAASRSVALTLPATLQAAGSRVRVEGLIHQRGSTSGGGYRLWLDPVTGITWAPLPTPDGLTSPGELAMAPMVSNALPVGAPTIAVPDGVKRGWIREIVTSLRVRAGSLELWRAGAIRLVVLPSCGEPVDHEGAAPYPEPR